MDIKSKIKNLLSFDEIDHSRRKFIKDAAGLAALTVIATQAPLLLKPEKINELRKQIEAGYVHDQTFYIYEPVVLDIDNVIIDNCKFIAMAPMDYMFYIKANNLIIKNSHIDGSRMGSGGIWVEPAHGDMTGTLQSAIDLAQDTIYLAPGTYHMNMPIEGAHKLVGDKQNNLHARILQNVNGSSHGRLI